MLHEEAEARQIRKIIEWIVGECRARSISKSGLRRRAGLDPRRGALPPMLPGMKGKKPTLLTLFRLVHALGFTIELRVVSIKTLEDAVPDRTPVDKLKRTVYGKD